eukprot:326710_1
MEDEASFLVAIIDCHPTYWYNSTADQKNQLAADVFINSVLVFLNAFLTLHRGNKLAVIGINPKISKLIYLSPTESNISVNNNEKKQNDNIQNECQQETEFSFSAMNETVVKSIREITETFSKTDKKCGGGSLLAGGLSHALCILNKVLIKDLPHIQPRVLCIYASNDISSQYIPIMNCIFSAQKRNILIDSCVLTTKDSLFLQQSSYLTGGIYSKPSHIKGLAQHLLMTFLASKSVRTHLSLPITQKVDFRASCFCHQKPVNIGVVCPVCLSIFCKQSPSCKTCGTRFPRKMVNKPMKN